MLSMLLVSSLLRAWTYGPRIRWFVVAPSLVPSVVWVPLSPSLSETGRLLANPLVWGVVLGIVLERLVAPGRPPLAAPA
jgi:hypothetical protein